MTDEYDIDSNRERNLRDMAVGQYNRWLYKRFRTIDFLDMADDQQPMSLHSVFIPPRAGSVAVAEKDVPRPGSVENEKEQGALVTELACQHPFLLLSGLPGSGKSTLVSHMVLELSDPDRVTEFQRALDPRPVVALPLILRELELRPELDLAQLIDLWLATVEREEARMDLPRLRQALMAEAGTEKNRQVLLLLDGIDEVGGQVMRKAVVGWARAARERGWRVVLTGRPSGFEGLSSELDQRLYHLLPFSWNQIRQFCEKWYNARDDWKKRKESARQSFLQALQDPQRPFLLELARRPIFLTLMSLVHLNRNQMPHGRADLYKQITDLYLVRQENHRQVYHRKRAEAHDGELPYWPEDEKRLALGYLAYQSQARGSSTSRSNRDDRQLVWEKEELLKLLREQLGERRYKILTPDQAEELLSFFLHPAGLLIAPSEHQIQFAHLSIQEYLCAHYLKGRIRGGDVLGQIRPHLGKPGWDEVALLLLTLYSEDHQKEGHFEVLAALDLTVAQEALLFLRAYTGRELTYSQRDREEWLPLAIAACVLHQLNLDGMLRRFSELNPTVEAIMREIFIAPPCQALKTLERFFNPSIGEITDAQTYWENLDQYWQKINSFSNLDQSQNQILRILNTWLEVSDPVRSALKDVISNWLQTHISPSCCSLIPDCGKEANPLLPYIEAILPTEHEMWQILEKQQPIYLSSLASLDPGEKTAIAAITNTRLLFSSKPGIQRAMYDLDHWVNLLYLTQDQARKRALALARTLEMVLPLAMTQMIVKTRLQTQTSTLKNAPILGRAQTLAQVLIQALGQEEKTLLVPERASTKVKDQLSPILKLLALVFLQTRPKVLVEVLNFLNEFGAFRHSCFRLFHQAMFLSYIDLTSKRLTLASFNYLQTQIGIAWFSPEESGEPPLGRPIPGWSHLFEGGRPKSLVRRQDLIDMQAWLNDPQRVLDDVYSQGLDDEDRQRYSAELQWLSQQAWGHHQRMAAVLEAWPEDEPTRTVMDHNPYEAEFVAALEEFVREHWDKLPDDLKNPPEQA